MPKERPCAILKIVRQARRFTHFLHISTAEEIQYLRDAKRRACDFYRACAHHLYLTENDVLCWAI
jgi:dihydroorotase-like cyclic amidohydrolase